MAINFKELNDKLEKSPLSDVELRAVDALEKYIDTEIINRYKGDELRFSLYKIKFERTLDDKTTSWPDVRRKLMYKELTKRYSEAGWKCKEEIADSFDRYSQDYWVLSGIK